ncbi:MAG TPA: efflux transporter outer membrane subunit, partial [Stellaceae bacterium]|nr:efflux transporter outer membrane subunit [Stellaceae bacterium]
MAETNLWRTLAALTFVSLCGCTVGPDYSRPAVETPTDFKEADGWRVAKPKEVPNEHWWTIYDDPVLSGLEAQVEVSNQNLKAAEAAYRQSVALVGEARSAYWPQVDANASALRANAGATGSGSRAIIGVSSGVTWEIDVWGKIRRNVESEVAGAQASAGDLAGARLSAQSLLAQQYFQLRIDDELERLLYETADAYELSLKITVNRYNAGTAARSDVTSAQTQVESTRAQAIAVGVQRAQLEHAIAVLIGKPPSQFSIAKAPLAMDVPVTPPGLPSSLLERRPDVAAAERRVASANAQIGVAEAAYYPD